MPSQFSVVVYDCIWVCWSSHRCCLVSGELLYFWTQKFFVELYIDMLKLLKKPGFCEAIQSNEKNEELLKAINRICDYKIYLNEDALQEDFNKIKNKKFRHNFFYPSKSPFHIIVCLLYCGLFLALVLCALINGPSDGWIGLYVVTFILAVFMNGYACAVLMLSIIPLAIVVINCILCCISSCKSMKFKYLK